MTTKIASLSFVVILFCVSMDVMGQDFQSLRKEAEITVKAQRPNWTLLKKIEYEKQISYSWGSAREGIGITIFFGDSIKEAAQRMALKNKILSVGPGTKRKEFGDEAYSWESPRGDSAGIRFRKANVYIEVNAPSLELAEELAKSFDKFIKTK